MLNKLPVVFATACQSVVKDKSIDELENPVQAVLNYLQRSLAIMIKSVMSMLYGTKETLQIMHLVSLKLSNLSENLKTRIRDKLDLTIKRCCRFQKRECIEANSYKDWLWYCKQMLPSDFDPHEEWKDLSEDLTSWNLDACLKLLQHAKCDDGTLLFDSKYIYFKSGVSAYSFSKLAAELWDHSLRGSYSLRNSNKKCEQHSMKLVEEFVQQLLQWFENEDGNVNNIGVYKEDIEKIRQIQKDYFDVKTAKWNEILKDLNFFNCNDHEFILVSAPCASRSGVVISSEDLAQLSIIPWAAVVDFDTKSKEDGLLHSFCKPESKYLKDSYLSTGKQCVADIFSVNDINCACKQSEFHVPWLFPHGESHNQTDKACPLNNYKQYKLTVRQPLNEVVKKLAKILCNKKSGGIISVVLCYGEYACKCNNTPYENFLHDLNHFCCNLEDYGNVIILTDNFFLQQSLDPLPVHMFPLDKLSKKVRFFFPENKDDLPPVMMPGQNGPERIECTEKDFELVHESVHQYEMHKYQNQKIIKLPPAERDEIKIRADIYNEVKVNFYKGQTVTWVSLRQCHAITRTVEHKITKSIRAMLDKHKTEPTKYVLYHLPGAGATTLARKIIWELRNDFPCVILKSDYILSDEKAIQTIKLLKDLYATLQLPILMLIDEEPFVNTVAVLSNHAQSNSIPMVFFHVQRINKSKKLLSKPDLKKQGYKDSIFLENKLCEEDIKTLQDRLVEDYGKERVIVGIEKIKKMNLSMMSNPTEKDGVTDLNKNGSITHIKPYKIDKMLSCYIIGVHWEDDKNETCYISNTDNVELKHRRVFLRTNISMMSMYEFYKTIHFYGLMCLDELFHEPMRNHIKTCMESISADELSILANISLLFAFNVCESIHSKAYEGLCYKITKHTKQPKFQLEDFIPNIALQFVTIIPTHHRFRIVHPFVAREIVECYFSQVKASKLQFLQDYLNCMLSTIEQPEVSEAVNRLLYYREYDDTIKRQQFSSLILTIESHWECPKGAAEILKYAASKVNNCHSYGHYARYLSKRLQEYDNAIKILEKAQSKTSQPSEEALVYNIEGDIHRDRLENYLKQHDTLNWKSADNKAFKFHLYACQAYRDSRQSNPMIGHPLFGELSVRLMLLEEFKRKVHKNKFFELLYACDCLEVVNSIDACHYLIEKLKDFIQSGEGGKDADSYEHSVTVHESHLTSIAGSVSDQKKSLLKLIKTCSDDVYKAHFRRSYVSLCINNPTDLNWRDLKDLTEKNFEHLGYNDRDMSNWLQVIKNIPNVARDMTKIEEQLLLWKDGPCVTPNNGSIQSKNNPLFVYFYLTICYFIQLAETKEDEVYDIVHKVKKYREETNKRSELIKSRGRVKEWLHKDGSGFEHLKSGKQKRDEMLRLNGSVVYSSWQEARQHNETEFPHISWKGLTIFFDPNATGHMYRFKRDDQVEFTVGFTFKGPRAITCDRVSSTHPTKSHNDE